MTTGYPDFVDPVQELRLRRWARLNFLAVHDRTPDLHPIVLEEMARMDRESVESERDTGNRNAASSYVPLAPMQLRIDRPHREFSRDRRISSDERVEQQQWFGS